MSEEVYTVASEQEMIELGEKLAQRLRPGDVVLLNGELGAGKTTLVKGLVKGLSIASPEEVTSPAFTLIHEYGDPPCVYHVDLYRLDTQQELESIGLEDYLERKDGICVIEWADKFPGYFPNDAVRIDIDYLDDNTRQVKARFPQSR